MNLLNFYFDIFPGELKKWMYFICFNHIKTVVVIFYNGPFVTLISSILLAFFRADKYIQIKREFSEDINLLYICCTYKIIYELLMNYRDAVNGIQIHVILNSFLWWGWYLIFGRRETQDKRNNLVKIRCTRRNSISMT